MGWMPCMHSPISDEHACIHACLFPLYQMHAQNLLVCWTVPQNGPNVFGEGTTSSLRTTFAKARKRLATKLQNPRLLRISFHTFRHWKATMLYHKTRDPYYVKNFLGHRSLRSTEIYINIERTIFESSSDEFTVKAVSKTEDVKALLEVGFEYVCRKDGLMFLRKRK